MDYDEEDGFIGDFPDEECFSDWIDNQYNNWAVAMGFDSSLDIQKWIETEMEDGDYYA